VVLLSLDASVPVQHLLKLPKPQALKPPNNTPTAMTNRKRRKWLLSQSARRRRLLAVVH
jgi:hypothetical protein